MTSNNYLTKKYMLDKYYNYNKDEVYLSKEKFVEFLKLIELEFYNHSFKIDNRYVCVGRHRFLIDEMEELYYTKEQCELKHLDTCPTVWCLDSLIELICFPNHLSLSDYDKLININDIYLYKDVNDCRKIYDSYISDDIISLNERDYILHALNMIKDSLKKCDENLKWNKQIKEIEKMNNEQIDNKVKAYMEEFINKPVSELPEDEQEFENYCKLYEERFGKRAYIAEPSGTREQTINAIKICLDKNEDLLDKLLYPNFEDDVNNGVLYSEHSISDTNETSKLISYEEYKHIFEKDSNGCYLRLVIPQEDNLPELNLVGKMPNNFTTEEVIRMKKYANKMFNMVDKKTMTNVEQNGNLSNDDDRKTIDFLCTNCGASTSMSFRRKFTTGNKVYARCTNCGNEISSDNPFN